MKSWTAKEIQEMHELVASGLPREDISRTLGRAWASVRAKYRNTTHKEPPVPHKPRTGGPKRRCQS